jgi:hypothetical protein
LPANLISSQAHSTTLHLSKESAKIKCGKAHFEALSVDENPATYMVARNIDDLMAKVV